MWDCGLTAHNQSELDQYQVSRILNLFDIHLNVFLQLYYQHYYLCFFSLNNTIHHLSLYGNSIPRIKSCHTSFYLKSLYQFLLEMQNIQSSTGDSTIERKSMLSLSFAIYPSKLIAIYDYFPCHIIICKCDNS